MPNDRSVGRPNNNPSRQEPRSVPVQKDAPRLNDERKVRPHGAGQPPMGIRPKHPGAQKEPKAPSDKLAGEYIQARDVPMQTMTEAELAEWNPLARFFKSRQPGNIPGLSIGYQVSKDGIDLYLLRDSRPIMHRRVDSHEAISQKMQDLQQQLVQLKQQRRSLSINPRKVAKMAAQEFANQQGIQAKIGELNREIPISPMGGMGGGMGTGGGSVPNTNAGQPAPTPMGRPGKPAPGKAPWGHRGEPLANPRRDFWNVKGGKAEAPTPTAAQPAAAQPANDASSGPPSMADQILMAANPKFYTPARLKAMTPTGKAQAIRKVKMAGGGVTEGYPDTSYERCEPAHQSRIGDLGWKGRQKPAGRPGLNKGFMQAREVPVANVREGYPNTDFEWCEPAHATRGGDINWNHKAKGPGWPGLNQKFAQPLDLPVEKVTETAEHDIDVMIGKTLRRLGLSEMSDMSAEMHPHAEPMQPALPGMGGHHGQEMGGHEGPEVDHITLPSEWASGLVNGDFSGLDDHEADQANMAMHKLAADGWEIADVARDEQGEGHEPRFTWQYQVHAPESQYRGGNVMDYVIHRRRPMHQMESKLPRVRARW